MRPEAKDICRTFLPLLDKILKLPLKRPISLTHEDGTIRALLILSQHLPHDVPQPEDSHASSTSAKEEDIIQYVGTNENIDEFIAEKRAQLARPVQPYLLAVKSSVTKKVQKYFLVLDDKCMQLTNCQIMRALDHLMASYFVFNVSYPYGWRNTLHFIASTFYEIFENTPRGQRKDGVTPSERELWLLLQN
ncbi:tRNA pseudouridine synthase A [Frankliniella fusca]|nr:tRNA pseudouridine synthase A [Frankliniella fusca]